MAHSCTLVVLLLSSIAGITLFFVAMMTFAILVVLPSFLRVYNLQLVSLFAFTHDLFVVAFHFVHDMVEHVLPKRVFIGTVASSNVLSHSYEHVHLFIFVTYHYFLPFVLHHVHVIRDIRCVIPVFFVIHWELD